MKENRVSRLHLDMDPRVDVDSPRGEEAEVHFVPFWFAVLGQLPEVTPRNDRKTSVLASTRPDRGPGRDNFIGWSHSEVAQVLV